MENGVETPLSPGWTLPYVRWRRPKHLGAGKAEDARQCHDHLFLFVAAGAGQVTINGTTLPMLPGRLFYILPSWWYRYRASESADLNLLPVHFDWVSREDSPRVRPFDTPTGLPLQPVFSLPGWDVSGTPWLDIRGDAQLQRAFETISTLPISAERSQAIEVQVAGWLLVVLGRLMSVAQAGDLPAETSHSPAILRRLLVARHRLEDVEARATPHEVAAQCGWSIDHFRALCRAVYGQTPVRIQTLARLRHAQQLLRGGCSSAEAARRSGFSDSSYFARLYRREMGITPGETRRERARFHP